MHQLEAVGKAIAAIEFRDDEKEIVMTFKVVDDDAWRKVQERVFTGFSQGGKKIGEMTPDPNFPGCLTYIAAPSEISLVDNPCLPDARFTSVKSDGSKETKSLRAFLADWSSLTELEKTQLMEEGYRDYMKTRQPAHAY